MQDIALKWYFENGWSIKNLPTSFESHPMRLFHAILLLLIWASPLHAQQSSPEPLVVPFAQFPPFLYLDEDGQRTGFIVDLAELIGAEIGVSIGYLDVANAREWVAAQASGRSQLIPGILKLPPLAESNVFSDEVAADVLRPAVLANDQEMLASDELVGARIAVVPPAVGSEEPILEQNIRAEYSSPQEALMDLLSEKVDAVLLPPPVVYGLARDARVDGRITFIGEPLRKATRHVALHESRADLLGPINEAIARIEADGRLEVLRQLYTISVPHSPPEVLRIGVTHLPPLSILGDGGVPSGFSVDAIQALAERAGLKIEFVPLALGDWVRGPTVNNLDAISALVINDDRRAIMDFTYPILERTAAMLVNDADSISATRIADLKWRRVGTIEGSIFARRAAASGITELLEYETTADLINAQLAGDVDVTIIAPDVAGKALEAAGLDGELRLIPLLREQIDSSIALRPGLGEIRERLNAVIPGYLLSDDYAALRQNYFGEPVFWTPPRIYGGLGAIATLVLGLLAYVVWQRLRQRQREYERQQSELAREQAHSTELSKLVSELERSNRELDEFAYIASHDLKEPLRGIGINANFLMRDALPGKAGERVLRMGELAGRMETLISDLLFFSRLGRRDDARVAVEPSSIIATIRSDLSEWLAERGGVIVEIGAIPSLKAEKLKVKTVLQNLIVNGIKYNDAREKHVEVGFASRVEVNGQVLENAIFVRDNGIGIGEEYRDKIFRIFSRLNKTADYGTGTGSGLAFVRKIVEEHGGVIDFNSTPGEGSTFFVTLPLAQDDVQSKTDPLRMPS